MNRNDLALRTLRAAVRLMPAGRTGWGAAMLAELAHIESRLHRWEFALGCVRVALFPPRKQPLLLAATENMHLMSTTTEPPLRAAARGALLLLPFACMNAIVANHVEPFFSLIRPGAHTSAREYVLLAAVLLLILAGAYLAARPLLRKDSAGRRRFYPLNALLALFLLLTFAAITAGLGADIYHCDVQGLPNCD